MTKMGTDEYLRRWGKAFAAWCRRIHAPADEAAAEKEGAA